MFTELDLQKSVSVLQQFGARRILLFGSGSRDLATARDLDLAVSGMPPQVYFRAVGELLFILERPVDLVDLDEKTPISQHVEKYGRVIYESR